MPAFIGMVTYESPHAPCGGITAVMGRMPGHIQIVSGSSVCCITPFHHQIEKTRSLRNRMSYVGQVSVPLDGGPIKVGIHQYDDQCLWYFLEPEDKKLFAGRRHPYDVGRTQMEIKENLRRDSLFFGAAVVQALPMIKQEARGAMLLQDWEAASVILALAEKRHEYELYLTLHNSYDSGATDADLSRVGIAPQSCPGDTILQRALPLAKWPVFTVSDQFALDFFQDPLQVQVMADHLQKMLRPRLRGVDNGPFADLAVSDGILVAATYGNFDPLRKWKHAKRKAALRALDDFVPSEDKPVWGDLKKFKRDNSAWFVLAGRDDARQKGYDVAATAINDFLEKGGDAQFLFFPIPGDEGLAGLNFLQKLSEKFPQHVLALPFVFKEGYLAALQGATYGAMPSLYEPFGMANEFYLNGTVGIGRATGGILQQIVPLRAASSFSRAVQLRAARWHAASAHPTGILYRERDQIESAVDDWRGINAAKDDENENNSDRVEQRRKYALFQAMADELRLAFIDGVRIYRGQPELYYRMLVEGIAYIQQSFSWERAAQEYVRNLGFIHRNQAA